MALLSSLAWLVLSGIVLRFAGATVASVLLAAVVVLYAGTRVVDGLARPTKP